MSSLSNKINALLWKIFIIRKKQFILTLIEICVPILIFLLLAWARRNLPNLKKEVVPEKINDVKSLEELYTYLSFDTFNLWFAPINNCTESVILSFQEKLNLPPTAIQSFTTEHKLLNAHASNNSFVVGVVFQECQQNKLIYDLKIYNEESNWDFSKLFVEENSYTEGPFKYINEGISAIQLGINISFLQLFKNIANFNFFVQEFPTVEHTIDQGINNIYLKILPLVTMFAFILQGTTIIKQMIEEKSSGVKEYMKMVGLHNSIIWFGWTFYCLICSIISIIVITVIMKIKINVEYPLIEHTNFTVIITFLTLYCLVSITFTQFIAAFSENSTNAICFKILFDLVTYFIPAYMSNLMQKANLFKHLFMALFPNMSLQYGYSALLFYESRGVGVNWSNIRFSGRNINSDITLLHVFIIYSIQIIIFTLLSLYIENIMPGKYGNPKTKLYPIQPLFKLFKSKQHQIEEEKQPLNQPKSVFEEVKENDQAIVVENLNKYYGKNHVIKNINCVFKENAITSIVGQNGSGKTTFMSMISRFISPTSGTITFKEEHSNKIGFCTQHNLLFDKLTVVEHLIFFSMLNGHSHKSSQEEADSVIDKIGLNNFKEKKAEQLSGGQKRLLCLGIAILNDPKVLILDEPTSGMDQENRSKTRQLLTSLKEKTTIIISTHYLHCASRLADSIAIVKNGVMVCQGSQMFLEDKYDIKYKIKVNYDNSNPENLESIKKTLTLEEKNIFNITDNSFEYFGIQKTELENTLISLKTHNAVKNADILLTNIEDLFLKAGANSIKPKVKISLFSKTSKLKIENLTCLGLLWKRCDFFVKLLRNYFTGIFTLFLFCLIPYFFKESLMFYENYYGVTELNPNIYGENSVIVVPVEPFETIIYKPTVLYTDDLPEKDINLKLTEIGNKNIFEYQRKFIVAENYKYINGNVLESVTAMYSNYALHSVPIAINLASNGLLNVFNQTDTKIHASISSLNLNSKNNLQQTLSEIDFFFIWLTFIPIGLFFFTNTFVLFPFYEIQTNFINLQFIMGVSKKSYWITLYMFDVLFGLIVLLIASGLLWLGLYKTNGLEYYTILIILFTFLISNLPYIYCFAYLKKISVSTALYITSQILIGTICNTVIMFVHLTEQQSKTLNFLFSIFPSYNLYHMISKFAKQHVFNYNWNILTTNQKNYLCQNMEEKNPCCFDDKKCLLYQNYFLSTQNGILYDIAASLVPIILFGVIIFINFIIKFIFSKIRYYKCKCKTSIKNTSNSVIELVPPPKDYILKVNRLSICSQIEQRLNNASFELNEKECVGILGRNGAGKSTLFKLLVREETPHSGQMLLNPDIKKNIIGYCPQENMLNMHITGYQIVHHLALAKGYSKKEAKKVTNEIIDIFGLEYYKHLDCKTYSGGTLRKFSTCLALLFNPKVILLDEPTAGVDPISKIRFQNAIKEIKKEWHSTILLSSHSLQEIDILCDRIITIEKGQICDIENKDKLIKPFYEIRFTSKTDKLKEQTIYNLRQPFSALNIKEHEKKENLFSLHCYNSLPIITSKIILLENERLLNDITVGCYRHYEEVEIKSQLPEEELNTYLFTEQA